MPIKRANAASKVNSRRATLRLRRFKLLLGCEKEIGGWPAGLKKFEQFANAPTSRCLELPLLTLK